MKLNTCNCSVYLTSNFWYNTKQCDPAANLSEYSKVFGTPYFETLLLPSVYALL